MRDLAKKLSLDQWRAYFLWHVFVIEDDDEHLHEVFCADLFVEGGRTFIHEHVEETKRQKHHFWLIRQYSLPYLESTCLPTTRLKQVKRIWRYCTSLEFG